MTLKIDRLLSIKARLSNATPGPWRYDSGNGEVESSHPGHYRIAVCHRDDLLERKEHCENMMLGYNPPYFPVTPDDDMEFIAHAWEDISYLIQVIEGLYESV